MNNHAQNSQEPHRQYRAAPYAMLQRQHAHTMFRDQPFSTSKFTQNFNHVLARPSQIVGMVAGIRRWAASLNASHSFIHVTTGSNLAATDRLMKAAGARTVGGAYVV